eukprot:TRINITY_DN15565_c1_g1_i1.p1 TRINITY_DN15565_c1_g1~~TRINITY_DN15565_c1_g1_i1.p1  ORF type:complete len:326 (-),score=47.44 TRINITY_DN15565_c1_g1_i1:592-1569(-)
MPSSFSLLSQLPTKPQKQPVFGPQHFVSGTSDYIYPVNNNSSLADQKDQICIKKHNSKQLDIDSPRGVDEGVQRRKQTPKSSIIYKGLYSSDEDELDEDDDWTSSNETSSSSTRQSIFRDVPDYDIFTDQTEDLDFLKEKFLIQEQSHQNMKKQLLELKNMFTEFAMSFSPDYIQYGFRRVSDRDLVVKLFAIESDLNSFSSKLNAFSRGIITAQTQVALGVTEVHAYNSSMAFKSDRIKAQGLLNNNSNNLNNYLYNIQIARKMVSEINDAQIYCNLLLLWARDLIKFNHCLQYETSNLQFQLSEYQTKLRDLKTSLWSQKDYV